MACGPRSTGRPILSATTQESSTPSKPTNPGGRITAIFSTEGELEGYAAETVHVYYNGDIPEAKYDTHSDPSTFYLTSRVYEVIRESGDEPLVVLPQPFPPVPPSVQNLPTQTTNTAGAATTTQFPTTTHADVAPQKTFKPQTSNTAQLHPFLQPNPTAQLQENRPQTRTAHGPKLSPGGMRDHTTADNRMEIMTCHGSVRVRPPRLERI